MRTFRTNFSYSLINTAHENCNLDFFYTLNDTYDLTIEIDGEGSTDPLEGTYTYVEGKEVTIAATPLDGWYFAGWTGNHTGDEEEITITMDEDKEITAHFEKEGDDEGWSLFSGVRNPYWWLILIMIAISSVVVSAFALLLSSEKGSSN